MLAIGSMSQLMITSACGTVAETEYAGKYMASGKTCTLHAEEVGFKTRRLSPSNVDYDQ